MFLALGRCTRLAVITWHFPEKEYGPVVTSQISSGIDRDRNRDAAEPRWRTYELVLGESQKRGDPRLPHAAKFEREGYHFGRLKIELALKAAGLLWNCKRQFLRATDFTPGFAYAGFSPDKIQAINRGSYFRSFDARSSWVMADILDFLKDEVSECLASPWKILNIRAWSTPPQTVAFGMYDWHTDGFVEQIFKIMLYLTPLTDEFWRARLQDRWSGDRT